MASNVSNNPSVSIDAKNVQDGAETTTTDNADSNTNDGSSSEQRQFREKEFKSSQGFYVTKRTAYFVLTLMVLSIVVAVVAILLPMNHGRSGNSSNSTKNGSPSHGGNNTEAPNGSNPEPNPQPNKNTTLSPPGSSSSASFCDSNDDFCWVQVGQTLTATNVAGINDEFGSRVSISDDGTRIVVSAPTFDQGVPRAGLIRVYDLDVTSATWKQWGSDIVGTSTQDSVVGVLSGNGQRLAVLTLVSDYNDKDIAIFDISDSVGKQPKKLGNTLRSTTQYWDVISVDFDKEGNTIVIGNPRYPEGSMQIYRYNGLDWNQQGQEIIGNGAQDERLGFKVAISGNASIVATSSYFANNTKGAAKTFRLEDGGQWILGDIVTGVDSYSYFGEQFALSSSGTSFAVSSYVSGVPTVSVYAVSADESNTLKPVGQDIKSSRDRETIVSLALSSDGTRLAIGRQFGGVNTDRAYLYIYDLVNGSWIQVGGTISFESYSSMFYSGMDMTSDGTRIVVGGTQYNKNGHSMVFELRQSQGR